VNRNFYDVTTVWSYVYALFLEYKREAKNIIALVRSSAPDSFMHEPFVSD